MSDRQTLLLATCAAVGAWLAIGPAPVWGAAIVALALLARRSTLLCLAVALLAGGLADRAIEGLHPPTVGSAPVAVTVLTDPAPYGAGIRFDGRIGPAHVEVRAAGRWAEALTPRLAGERVWVTGSVAAVGTSAPWLAVRHIGGRLTVTSVQGWEVGSPVSQGANLVRRTLSDGATVLPGDQRPLFLGLTLGDDRGQSIVTTDDFRAAGLSHLLAVSGQNVAFVLVLCGPLLRRLAMGPRAAVALGAIGFFALLTRFEPSVLRASAMAAIAAVATAIGRPSPGLRYLALAVTALVLLDPFLVRSLGFQLSVLASASILVLAGPIADRCPGPRWLAESVGVAVAAQVGVSGLLVATFGGVPVVAIPANLLAAPAAGPIMVWGLVGGLAAGIAVGLGATPIAVVLHLPTRVLVGWLAMVADRAAAAPFGELGAGELAVLAVGVAAIALAVCLRRRGDDGPGLRQTGLRGAGIALIGIALMASTVSAGRGPGGAVPLLTVPAEAAALWRRGGGAVVVLDDGVYGPDLLEGLRRRGAASIDVAIVTGGDRSARTAATALAERFPALAVLAPRNVDGLVVDVVDRPTALAIGGLAVAVAPRAGRLEVRVEPA